MHGIGMNGFRSKAEQKKWEVAYRCKDGGFGIIGWVCLFARKADALAYGEKFKAEHDYVEKVWAQHPSPMYSAY